MNMCCFWETGLGVHGDNQEPCFSTDSKGSQTSAHQGWYSNHSSVGAHAQQNMHPICHAYVLGHQAWVVMGRMGKALKTWYCGADVAIQQQKPGNTKTLGLEQVGHQRSRAT
jgi:hypothetical protein